LEPILRATAQRWNPHCGQQHRVGTHTAGNSTEIDTAVGNSSDLDAGQSTTGENLTICCVEKVRAGDSALWATAPIWSRRGGKQLYSM
jgi:hypothetical protein